MAVKVAGDDQVTYWSGELDRAKKRFTSFWDYGDGVVDVYRQQKADGNDTQHQERHQNTARRRTPFAMRISPRSLVDFIR